MRAACTPSQAAKATFPCSSMPGDLGHGRAAADHRHRPLVEVGERLRLPPVEECADRLGGRVAALERDGTELRVEPVLGRDVGDVADREDAGEAGDRQVPLDIDPAALALRQACRLGDGRGLEAAAPDDAARQDRRTVRQGDVARSDLGHSDAEAKVDAVLLEDARRVGMALVGEHRQELLAMVHEVDPCARGERRELVRHRGRDHLGQGAGDLDAGRDRLRR